jgi:hypothetical protein
MNRKSRKTNYINKSGVGACGYIAGKRVRGEECAGASWERSDHAAPNRD